MRKIDLMILTTCIVASCSATKEVMNIDDNIKKISVGMSKKKVTSILGDDYEITSSKENTSTLAYKSSSYGMYRFAFVDNELKEWRKDYFRNHKDNRNIKKNKPKQLR